MERAADQAGCTLGVEIGGNLEEVRIELQYRTRIRLTGIALVVAKEAIQAVSPDSDLKRCRIP